MLLSSYTFRYCWDRITSSGAIMEKSQTFELSLCLVANVLTRHAGGRSCVVMSSRHRTAVYREDSTPNSIHRCQRFGSHRRALKGHCSFLNATFQTDSSRMLSGGPDCDAGAVPMADGRPVSFHQFRRQSPALQGGCLFVIPSDSHIRVGCRICLFFCPVRLLPLFRSVFS